MSHTPGPWHAIIDNEGDVTYVTADSANDRDICDFYHVSREGSQTYPKENAEANARLVAAAPEMLAALEVIEMTLRGLGHLNLSDHAADLIKRAKGES